MVFPFLSVDCSGTPQIFPWPVDRMSRPPTPLTFPANSVVPIGVRLGPPAFSRPPSPNFFRIPERFEHQGLSSRFFFRSLSTGAGASPEGNNSHSVFLNLINPSPPRKSNVVHWRVVSLFPRAPFLGPSRTLCAVWPKPLLP